MDHLVAGTVGAAAGLCVTRCYHEYGYEHAAWGQLAGYPLDLAKVRLQAQSTSISSSPAVSTILAASPSTLKNAPVFTGVIDCLKKTIHHGGAKSLFAGAATPLIASMPGNAFLFGVYGTLLHQIAGVNQPASNTPISSVAIAGAAAGGTASIIATPVELVKCRLQNQCATRVNTVHSPTDGARYTSSWNCAERVVRGGGIRALYRGFGLTGARDFFGVGIYFSTYQFALRQLKANRLMMHINKNNNSINTIIAGGISGIVSWTAVHPIDVIKSRMQLQQDNMSWYGIVRHGVANEGGRFFTKGLLANIMRAFPMCGCTFLVYEGVMASWPRSP